MLPAGELYLDWRALHPANVPQAAKGFSQVPAIGQAEDLLQRLELFRRGAVVNIEPALPLGLAHKAIAALRQDDAQAVQRHFAILAALHIPGAVAIAVAIGGRLGRVARADQVAVAGLEVQAGDFPAAGGVCVHRGSPFSWSAWDCCSRRSTISRHSPACRR